ncbi:MAG: hypothetical protein ACYDC3_19635 [Candidatus Binataceae bacterium]
MRDGIEKPILLFEGQGATRIRFFPQKMNLPGQRHPASAVFEYLSQGRDFTIYRSRRKPLGKTLSLKGRNVVDSEVRNEPCAELTDELARVLLVIHPAERREGAFGSQPFLCGQRE